MAQVLLSLAPLPLRPRQAAGQTGRQAGSRWCRASLLPLGHLPPSWQQLPRSSAQDLPARSPLSLLSYGAPPREPLPPAQCAKRPSREGGVRAAQAAPRGSGAHTHPVALVALTAKLPWPLFGLPARAAVVAPLLAPAPQDSGMRQSCKRGGWPATPQLMRAPCQDTGMLKPQQLNSTPSMPHRMSHGLATMCPTSCSEPQQRSACRALSAQRERGAPALRDVLPVAPGQRLVPRAVLPLRVREYPLVEQPARLGHRRVLRREWQSVSGPATTL